MKINKKSIIELLWAFLISVILINVVTHSVSAPTTFTLSNGIYPGAPSFTIWQDGDSYCAENRYGEIKYSGVNATQIIQSAIDNSEGEIFLQNGIYEVDNLMLDNRTYLHGESTWTTILQLRASITVTAVISLKNNNTEGVIIEKLTVNGNRGNDASGMGIYLNNLVSGFGFTYGDSMHKITDVIITNCSSWGFYAEGSGAREYQLTRVYAYSNYQGFRLGGGDYKIVDVVAGNNDGQGMYYSFATGTSVNIKAFGNGEDQSIPDPYGIVVGGIIGWYQFENVYLQDNYFHGMVIYNTGNVTICNVIAERNGLSGTDCAGIRLDNAKHVVVHGGIFGNRGAETITQDFGIWEAGNSDYNTFADIDAYYVEDVGIIKVGVHTHASGCWNKTTWIPYADVDPIISDLNLYKYLTYGLIVLTIAFITSIAFFAKRKQPKAE